MPHAKPPADDSSKEWVNFAVAEAGQKELDTRDKKLAKKVLHMCEQEGAEALARAKQRMKPWWKRIFSGTQLRQHRPWAAGPGDA